MTNPKIVLVVFGEIDRGKSTLCNTFISSHPWVFIENEKTEVQTFETVGKKGRFGQQEIFLIDNTGWNDEERNDTAHIK